MLASEARANSASNGSPFKEHSRVVFKHLTLWIDGVGGFLLWYEPSLVVGQSCEAGPADIGIMGDIGRTAFAVHRTDRDYFLQPCQPLRVDGTAIVRPQLLRDGSKLELGSAVQLRFRQPHVLSATARLEKVSPHRWQPQVDAVLMLSDYCIIGPRPGSHILCLDWENEITLLQQAGTWVLRSELELEVNHRTVPSPIAIGPGMSVRSATFSLSFE